MQGAKDLAKALGATVVMLRQLNRNVGSRQDKRPTLLDLRESGELEQKADVMLFLHRKDYYDADSHMKGTVELIPPKGRNLRLARRFCCRTASTKRALTNGSGAWPERSRSRFRAAMEIQPIWLPVLAVYLEIIQFLHAPTPERGSAKTVCCLGSLPTRHRWIAGGGLAGLCADGARRLPEQLWRTQRPYALWHCQYLFRRNWHRTAADPSAAGGNQPRSADVSHAAIRRDMFADTHRNMTAHNAVHKSPGSP